MVENIERKMIGLNIENMMIIIIIRIIINIRYKSNFAKQIK